jgi:DDE superfamily endonuclease
LGVLFQKSNPAGYLPRRWTDDPQRCAQAGVPAERGFATKPQLVLDMLDRALAAGVPFRYFTADSGYGRDPALRARCHTAALSYMLAVPVDLPLLEPGGGATCPDHVRGGQFGVGAPLLRRGHQGRPLPGAASPRRVNGPRRRTWWRGSRSARTGCSVIGGWLPCLVEGQRDVGGGPRRRRCSLIPERSIGSGGRLADKARLGHLLEVVDASASG